MSEINNLDALAHALTFNDGNDLVKQIAETTVIDKLTTAMKKKQITDTEPILQEAKAKLNALSGGGRKKRKSTKKRRKSKKRKSKRKKRSKRR